MNKKIVYGGILVAIVIAIGAYQYPNSNLDQQKILKEVVNAVNETLNTGLGAVGTRFQHGASVGTNTSPAINGLKVGDNGTEMAEIKTTTCSLQGTGTGLTVSATTTKAIDCAVTGIASGDWVMAQFGTSTPTGFGGWLITGAAASTTAGIATLQVMNLTGVSAQVPANIASTTDIYYVDIP